MASSQPSSSLASPPTQLESFLLRLNDCSQDELENSLEVCKWVLEVLDFDTNGIVRLDAWADLCVSLAKASRCKKTGEDPRKFFNTGILDVAPFCHLGMMDISDLAGTSLWNRKVASCWGCIPSSKRTTWLPTSHGCKVSKMKFNFCTWILQGLGTQI